MTHANSITAFAPATVANVACGFDILGFAVSAPGDEVLVRKEENPGVRITRITGDDGKLPDDPERNTATVPLIAMLQELRLEVGLSVEIAKKMPLGSGLGSSAASAVAAAVAANELLGAPFTRRELLPFLIEAERVACGSAHADNIAPSLLGGFVLVRSTQPIDVVSLPVPPDLYCSLIHPQIEIRTEDARKILRKEVRLEHAVQQWGNTAALVAALYEGDYPLLSRSLEDVVIEPRRSILIPRFHEIKAAVMAAGALGCSISGSGPSLFALARGREIAERVGSIMCDEFKTIDIASEVYVSQVNVEGARIVS